MSDGREVPSSREHAVLGLEPLAPLQRAAELHLRAQDGQQPRVLPRLLDEVARAAAHGLDRQVDAAPRGHHDDRHGSVELLQPREEREALRLRTSCRARSSGRCRATSKSRASTAASTAAGEVAVSIPQPSPLSSRRSACSTSGWSSAMRTRAFWSTSAAADAGRAVVVDVGRHQSLTIQPSRSWMIRDAVAGVGLGVRHLDDRRRPRIQPLEQLHDLAALRRSAGCRSARRPG